MLGRPRELFRGLALGEGPVWLARRGALAFVDITQGLIHLLEREEEAPRTFQMGDMVGCVVPTAEGNLLAGVRDTLVELNLDSGERHPYLKLEQPGWLRFNDGKCDAQGRLWVGSMAEEQDIPAAAGGGRLACVRRGRLIFSQGGYTIPNGLAFCPDGSFYHTDSATGGIDRCVFTADGGILERTRTVDIPPEYGLPDGFCRDVDGNLWVALWGGGAVAWIEPKSGRWLHTLTLPDRNVSCCCFGGAELSTLYITTARDEEGRGGCLYAVDTRTRGEVPYPYRKD